MYKIGNILVAKLKFVAMRKIWKYIFALIACIFVLFLVLRIAWYIQPKNQVNVYILDKTVSQKNYPEHASLTWLLNNLRIVNFQNKSYSVSHDYMGFYPIDFKKELFDFKSVRINEIEGFAADYDMAYYADCYGVFSFEWYKNTKFHSSPSSKVYGGLNQNDFLLLKKMHENGKIVIGEYNMFGSPTNALIRNKSEELFNLSWSGWSGKSFSSLNPNDKDGPDEWMPKLYESQHLKSWPIDKKGIILINNDGLIDLLIVDEDITSFIPSLTSSADAVTQFKLPKQEIGYSGWFEFVTANQNAQVLASFTLNTTSAGNEHLAKIGLSANFPAVVQASANEPTFYFTGDFAHNQVCGLGAKLKGGKCLNLAGTREQKVFFRKFYYPLIKNIINEYSSKESAK